MEDVIVSDVTEDRGHVLVRVRTWSNGTKLHTFIPKEPVLLTMDRQSVKDQVRRMSARDLERQVRDMTPDDRAFWEARWDETWSH